MLLALRSRCHIEYSLRLASATTATTTTTISTLISLPAAADGALPGALLVHRNRSGKLFPHDRAGVQLGVWSSAPACGGITLRGAFNCRSTPNSAVAVAHPVCIGSR